MITTEFFVMNTQKLTPKRSRFVDEYLIDLNGAGAYVRAGYKAKNDNVAAVEASRLLRIPNIQMAVALAKKRRSETVEINAEWVLRQAVEVYKKVTQEIRPVRNPKTGKQVFDDDGNALFTFNSTSAIRALEIIGKHVDVAAFKDRIEVTNGNSLTDRIRAAKQQAYQPAKDRLSKDSAPK